MKNYFSKLIDQQGEPALAPSDPTIFWSKVGNHKSESTTFLFVINMWDFSLFIELKHKWQNVDALFRICCFSSELSYHSHRQRVCKFVFLMRNFVKTNDNYGYPEKLKLNKF